MLVEGDRHHGGASVANEGVALLIICELQQLLAKVVTEGIGHELNHVRGSLIEDDLQVLRGALLELLLQETAAVLVLAEAVDLMARHGLQVVVHEAVGIVLKSTALDDASLAVLDATTRSISSIGIVVRNVPVATEHAVGTIGRRSAHLLTRAHVHASHSTRQHRHVVAVEVRGAGNRSGRVLRHGWGSDSASNAVAWGGTRHGRAEGSSACVKARIAVGYLAAVAVVHSVVRNPTQVGIVVVQMLFSMGVEAETVRAVRSSTILEGGNVARGVRLGQLGHAVGGAGKA
jgi:hypothetical protein